MKKYLQQKKWLNIYFFIIPDIFYAENKDTVQNF